MSNLPSHLPSLPSRDQMLEVFGMEARRRHPLRNATLFSLGLLAGAFLALMFAGPSAAELRSRVRRAGRNGAGDDRAERVSDTLGNP
jgi:hypothetical protein